MRERHVSFREQILRLRVIGEKDLRISPTAYRLLCRICSQQRLDNRENPYAPFPVPWTLVAHWCGLGKKSKATARCLLWQLVSMGYLYNEGVKGCPAQRFYRLNFDIASPQLVNGVIPSLSRRPNFDKLFRQLKEAH